jgi:hypothetical protein
MKRWIIFLHRYLGIPMSIVFVIWFVSGIFMIYAGDMPALTEADRLRHQGTIDLSKVTLSPSNALARSGIEGNVTGATLKRLLGRPAWEFRRVFGRDVVVFADTGETFDGASPEDGRAAVADFFGRSPDEVDFVETIGQVDQWTLTEARKLPLELFAVDDGRGTRAYFSLRTGEVELVTDRTARTLAWIGTIPHWFYFTALRTNQPLWYRTVVWASIAGCILAVLGLILAVTQFRRSKPFRLKASVRYRGWMRWHYYTGAVFGVFALTWVFSGLMSMEPFDWTNAEGMYLPDNDLEGGSLEIDRYALDSPRAASVVGDNTAEVDLLRIQTVPYFSVAQVNAGGTVSRRLIDAATLEPRTTPFSVDSIIDELVATVTEAGIVRHDVLEKYDAYYYDRDDESPLPVLRVKFDDPASTWAYFDLATSRHLGSNHRLSRIERWLFNGLHSLDFSFWYGRRPLWDIALIILCLGALATSSIGMYLGFRRLAGRGEGRLSADRES